MNDHLSLLQVNALADGELETNEFHSVTDHLRSCPACTTRALEQSLLKSTTTRTGQRFALPGDIRKRVEDLVQSQNLSSGEIAGKTTPDRPSPNRSSLRIAWAGWAAAAILLVLVSGLTISEINERRAQTSGALAMEIGDQHVATLAANLPPQVLSSDRHTVKPWFQGKIPFSFNLPEGLPEDTRLDGGNLAYLHGRPTAQLLYSIGKHRVSVFMQQRAGAAECSMQDVEHDGFHLTGFCTDELNAIAISDVDPTRLSALLSQLKQAQAR